MNKHIETEPFKVAHMGEIDRRNIDQTGLSMLCKTPESLKKLADMGVARTLRYDGKIICFFGWMEFWPGVCEVWVIPSVEVPKYPLVFARYLKKEMSEGQVVLGYHRVQATAIDDDMHNRFFKFLGFKSEGILKKFSAEGQDYRMWARII